MSGENDSVDRDAVPLWRCPRFRRLLFLAMLGTTLVVSPLGVVVSALIPLNGLINHVHVPEANAITTLKGYGSAQQIYKKGNYSARLDPTKPNRYAIPFTLLYGKGKRKFALISRVMAQATSPANGYMGYYFIDAKPNADPTKAFGLFAQPCVYGDTAVNTYYIDETGTVVGKDLGGQVPTPQTVVDSTWWLP